jgi:hypothetical protein
MNLNSEAVATRKARRSEHHEMARRESVGLHRDYPITWRNRHGEIETFDPDAALRSAGFDIDGAPLSEPTYPRCSLRPEDERPEASLPGGDLTAVIDIRNRDCGDVMLSDCNDGDGDRSHVSHAPTTSDQLNVACDKRDDDAGIIDIESIDLEVIRARLDSPDVILHGLEKHANVSRARNRRLAEEACRSEFVSTLVATPKGHQRETELVQVALGTLRFKPRAEQAVIVADLTARLAGKMSDATRRGTLALALVPDDARSEIMASDRKMRHRWQNVDRLYREGVMLLRDWLNRVEHPALELHGTDRRKLSGVSLSRVTRGTPFDSANHRDVIDAMPDEMKDKLARAFARHFARGDLDEQEKRDSKNGITKLSVAQHERLEAYGRDDNMSIRNFCSSTKDDQARLVSDWREEAVAKETGKPRTLDRKQLASSEQFAALTKFIAGYQQSDR